MKTSLKSMALLLGLGLTSVNANALELVFGGFSHHFGARDYTIDGVKHDFNEVNGTIGISGGPGGGFTLVVMDNSYDKTSVVVTKDFSWRFNDNWGWGVKLGMATGYGGEPTNLPIAPIGQVELIHTYKSLSTVLGFMPAPGGPAWGVATLSWKWKF